MAADRGRRDVDERRFAGDRQRFGEAADFHRQIERRRLADRERDAAAVERLEAFELRGDAVASGNHLRGEVAALGRAGDLAHDAGFFVGDDDGHARQDAALRVADLAAELCRALLRECWRGRAQQDAVRDNPRTSLRICPSSDNTPKVERRDPWVRRRLGNRRPEN